MFEGIGCRRVQLHHGGHKQERACQEVGSMGNSMEVSEGAEPEYQVGVLDSACHLVGPAWVSPGG